MDPLGTMGLEPQWWWLILALLLAIAEIIVPGFFLIWLGAAALLTGIVTLLLGIGTPAQFILFAVASIAAVYAARRWLRDNPVTSSDPMLNERTARLIGEIVTVVEAIDGGRGRVKVGDGIWQAHGPDTPAGAKVRVMGAEGTVLVVDAV